MKRKRTVSNAMCSPAEFAEIKKWKIVMDW